MESLTLPLFTTTKETPILNPQQKEISPLRKSSIEANPHTQLTNALSSIFPTQTEETKATRTRRILGDTAKNLSDEQIEAITTQFQFLVDTWLDEFEKDVFEGRTLKELLGDSPYANYKQD